MKNREQIGRTFVFNLSSYWLTTIILFCIPLLIGCSKENEKFIEYTKRYNLAMERYKDGDIYESESALLELRSLINKWNYEEIEYFSRASGMSVEAMREFNVYVHLGNKVRAKRLLDEAAYFEKLSNHPDFFKGAETIAEKRLYVLENWLYYDQDMKPKWYDDELLKRTASEIIGIQITDIIPAKKEGTTVNSGEPE